MSLQHCLNAENTLQKSPTMIGRSCTSSEKKKSTLRARTILFWVCSGVFALLGVLLLARPSSATFSSTVASPTPGAPTATPLPGSIGVDGFGAGVNPLTGQMVADPSTLARRPLAVKISNAPDLVRPQAGLSMADMVFEHYVEAGLTRFTAVFYAESPPYIGSVRSARLIDLQIPLMTEALFAFSGANGPTMQRLRMSPFAERLYVNAGEPLFFRDPSIELPHNLFVSPSEIWRQAAVDGVNEVGDLSGLAFSIGLPPNALSSADRLLLDYGATVAEWRYDFGTQQYHRWTDGDAHHDALNGEQIAVENVVIVWAHHQDDYTVVSSEWAGEVNYAFELQIWSLGPVTLFRDGLRYDGWWHRWNDEQMLTFWRDDTMAERLYLKPGKTWFQMVPLDFAGLIVQAMAFP